MDIHGDTSCVGANCHIISYTEHVCEVSPFHLKYNPITNVPIEQAGAAYDDLNSGQTYILIINQATFFWTYIQRKATSNFATLILINIELNILSIYLFN